MGWAEELDSLPVDAQENPWEAEIDGVEEVEAPDSTPAYQKVIDRTIEAPGVVLDAVGNAIEGIGEIESVLARRTAAGLYKMSGDLLALGAAGVETIYDAGRVVGTEARLLVTDEERPVFEKTNYLSEGFKETTESDIDALKGDDESAFGDYVQKIAEYAGITQAITRQFVTSGAALLKDPALVSSNVIKSAFQKSMMAAAENPKLAIKIEQGVSALVASSGETAKQLGVEPTGQLLTEITTGILSGKIINTGKAIANFISKKVPGSADRIGKIQAAEYLQEVASSDPKFMEKLGEGLKLQAETGIEMNLAQLTNNPELKAALVAMEVHTAGSITALEARLAEQTRAIKAIFKSDTGLKDSAVKGVEDFRSGTETALEKQANQAIDNVLEQVDNASPLDKEMLGETGRNALNASRESMSAGVDQLYKEVGNPNIPTQIIEKALIEARKSPLKNDNYMKSLDSDLISTLETNLLGKAPTRTLDAPNKAIQLRGGGARTGLPKEMSLDGVRLIESRLKEHIRIANAAGESQKSRLLGKILNGVFEQYKNVPSAAAFEVSNLKKAASASKRLHEIFDQGEVLLQSKINVKGMERITTEGFVRNFVKPNADTSSARTDDAVDGFYNAYGDMPEARKWMTNAFGSLLKEEIGRHGGKVRPKQIRAFINKHSNFLKRARITGEFDSVVKAIDNSNAADDALTLDYKNFQKTVMSKFIGSDDPVNFIVNAAQSGRLNKLNSEIANIPNKAKRELVQRGIKEALWEGVKRRLTTAKSAAGEEVLLNTGSVRKMLDDINYGKELKTGLGNEHYNSLKQLINVVDRISPEVSSTAGLPKAHIDENLVEKLMTGLRAAAHGFVRPDLIAAQMSMRGYKAITTKQAHKILKEAMENPKMAKELLKLSTTIHGRKIVGTMFSPLVAPVVTDRDKEKQSK